MPRRGAESNSLMLLVVVVMVALLAMSCAAATKEENLALGFDQSTSPRNVNVQAFNFGLPFGVTHTAKMRLRFPLAGKADEKFEGDVAIALFGNIVPKTVENFVGLCNHEHGFGYRNSSFHRVVRNFLAQGGDFETNEGFGGHSIHGEGKTFSDESYVATHQEGSVAMAAEGYDENGSQFYILATRDGTRHLDGIHVVFGHVVSGYRDVVRKMMNVPVNFNDVPKDRVEIVDCHASVIDEEQRVPREERHAAQLDTRRAQHQNTGIKRRRGSLGGAPSSTDDDDNNQANSGAAAAAGGDKDLKPSDDPSNRRTQGPRRLHDPPHRTQHHLNERVQRQAEFEAREHRRREQQFGERAAPLMRDRQRKLSTEGAESFQKNLDERKKKIEDRMHGVKSFEERRGAQRAKDHASGSKPKSINRPSPTPNQDKKSE